MLVSNDYFCIKYVSCDVTVSQWITSYHKLFYDHMLHKTFSGNKSRHDDVHYNNINFH